MEIEIQRFFCRELQVKLGVAAQFGSVINFNQAKNSSVTQYNKNELIIFIKSALLAGSLFQVKLSRAFILLKTFMKYSTTYCVNSFPIEDMYSQYFVFVSF